MQKTTDAYTCFCGGRLSPLSEPTEKTVKKYRSYQASLFRCFRCSHIQFLPIPPDDILEHFYTHDWTNDADLTADVSYGIWTGFDSPVHNQSYIRRITATAMRLFNAFEGVRVLDIGCGFGALVHALNLLGFDAYGLDLNDRWLAQGVAKGNTKIAQGTIDDAVRDHPEGFDIVVSHHSLEHIPRPLEFLSQVRKVLSPRGTLIARLPNGNYLPALLDSFARHTWCMYPAHLHYFTPQSIVMASRLAGMRAVEIAGTLFEEDVSYDWLLQNGKRSGLPLRHYSRTALLEDIARLCMTREIDFNCCRDDGHPSLPEAVPRVFP